MADFLISDVQITNFVQNIVLTQPNKMHIVFYKNPAAQIQFSDG